MEGDTTGNVRYLRPADSALATGEDVMREGAALLVGFFRRRLPELRPEDPWRAEIQDLASQCSALAELRLVP